MPAKMSNFGWITFIGYQIRNICGALLIIYGYARSWVDGSNSLNIKVTFNC
jgi:hypothetical protein